MVSVFLSMNPKILFRIQRSWLSFGYNHLDLRVASWVISRPEWLRRNAYDERIRLQDELPLKEGNNTYIAERLVHMQRYEYNNKPVCSIPPDSIWGMLREAHYDTLRSLVQVGETTALDTYLSRLFRTKTVNGYTYGSTFDRWPHRWHYLPVYIELSVIQLAEALGLIRSECHEQGEIAFWRKIFSEEELIERLESCLGFRVEQPRFGDPRGIIFGGRFLTRDTCSCVYSAYKVRIAIERKGICGSLDIVEIGGGFGGLCYWLTKILRDRVRRYIIVDLPEVRLVQAFFLGSAFANQVILPGDVFEDHFPSIQLLDYSMLDEIKWRPNILINQDSMPEMPEAEVKRYLNWAAYNLDGLFISFNQETYSRHGDKLQTLVSDAVQSFPRFRRISRETSWVRRGYVEEVYDTVSQKVT